MLSNVESNEKEPNSPPIIGSTEIQMIKALNLQGKFAKLRLMELLSTYSNSIKVFGIKLRRNPLNNRWFLSKSPEIIEYTSANPFQNKARLGATLMTIISAIYTAKKPVEKKYISELRKKASIDEDLKELMDLHFIRINNSKISLDPYLGYCVDFTTLFSKLEDAALKFDAETSLS